MTQQPQLSFNPEASMTPNSGIEDAGFEPPVIFSRVVGKERRFVQHQPQDSSTDPSSLTSCANVYSNTTTPATPTNRIDDAVPQINPVSQSPHGAVPSRSVYESDFRYLNEGECSSQEQMMQHYVPAARQSPLKSPQTPSRVVQEPHQQPPTTHLDDVIAHVVSDAVAYANEPVSGRPVYNESPAQYLISESNKSNRLSNYPQEAQASQQYSYNAYSMPPQQKQQQQPIMEGAMSQQPQQHQLRQMPVGNNNMRPMTDFSQSGSMYEQQDQQHQGVRFRPIPADIEMSAQSPHATYMSAQTPYYVPPSPFISSGANDGSGGQMGQGRIPSIQSYEGRLLQIVCVILISPLFGYNNLVSLIFNIS